MELCRLKPETMGKFAGEVAYLALDAIRESIAELQHYRGTLFGL